MRTGFGNSTTFGASDVSVGRRLLAHARASEWWDFKLSPGLAVLYASAFINSVAPRVLYSAAILYLTALVAGATFVSALNDLADRREDRRASKFNPAHAGSTINWLMLGCSGAVGAAMLYAFSNRPILFAVYLAGWVAFSAYSLPPFRFKGRTVLGLICDAVGAHVVPAVLAVVLIKPDAGLTDPWTLIVASWSLCFGLRGILAHQLADEAFDQRSGTRTFVVHYGRNKSERIVRFLLFPIEVLMLALMVIRIGSITVPIALALSLIILRAKVSLYDLRPSLTGTSRKQIFVLSEFYIFYLPLGLIVSLALQNLAFAFLAPLHCLLFSRQARNTSNDIRAVISGRK